jgi:hypothetical protein
VKRKETPSKGGSVREELGQGVADEGGEAADGKMGRNGRVRDEPSAAKEVRSVVVEDSP